MWQLIVWTLWSRIGQRGGTQINFGQRLVKERSQIYLNTSYLTQDLPKLIIPTTKSYSLWRCVWMFLNNLFRATQSISYGRAYCLDKFYVSLRKFNEGSSRIAFWDVTINIPSIFLCEGNLPQYQVSFKVENFSFTEPFLFWPLHNPCFPAWKSRNIKLKYFLRFFFAAKYKFLHFVSLLEMSLQFSYLERRDIESSSNTSGREDVRILSWNL